MEQATTASVGDLIADAMTTGLNEVISNYLDIALAILPIGLTAFSVYYAVIHGKKFFKGSAAS